MEGKLRTLPRQRTFRYDETALSRRSTTERGFPYQHRLFQDGAHLLVLGRYDVV